MNTDFSTNGYVLPKKLNDDNALREGERFIEHIPGYSGDGSGRGIVVCGGGIKYLTCAWICVSILRRLGCRLPVELWHLGPLELDEKLKPVLALLDIKPVDAHEVRKSRAARILNGWELKPFALIHSRFKEAILLDADNVPVVNPEFLFETPEYKRTGAIFWPDFGRLEPSRTIWLRTGVEYRDEPEFESGQMVVNKERCWRALQLTKWYNDYSDYFYSHIHGDKETFHIAWRKLRQEYAMPSRGIHSLHATMCQHDFEGRRIFQHRNMAKWSLVERNPRIEDFWLEQECMEHLEEFRGHLTTIKLLLPDQRTPAQKEAFVELTKNTFIYVRVGHDLRPMRFNSSGLITLGAGGCEACWDLKFQDGEVILNISSETSLTCRLRRGNDAVWRGAWENHEQMPIELVPVPPRLMGARPQLAMRAQMDMEAP